AMTGRAQVAEVQLTNPTRLLYPKDGITKQDVATYYDAVSGPLLAAIRDRPLAVIHWNQGIGKPGWFQQNTGQEAEPWMTVVATAWACRASRRRPASEAFTSSCRWRLGIHTRTRRRLRCPSARRSASSCRK